MQHYNSKLIIFFIVSIMILPGASIDLYVPSLPFIMHYFVTNHSAVQTSVTVYLIGYGAGQFILGAVSDSFGRRGILLVGCVIYFLACFAATLSPDIHLFLLSRLVQGLALAGPSIAAKALISDCFTGHELRKVANYMTIAWASGPIFAPFIGSYLQHYFGWQSCFYLLAIYSLFIFICSLFYLPETKLAREPFYFSHIKYNYRMVLSNRFFIGCFLLLTLQYSLLPIFNVIGPFLIQKALHFSVLAFGRLAILLGIAFFIGNLLNRPLLNYFTNKQIIVGTIWFILMFSVAITIVAYFLPLNIYVIMISTCILFIGSGIMAPNGFGIALSLFPKLGGSVNAILGGLFVLGSSLSSLIASSLNPHSQMPLMYLYVTISAILVFVFYTFLYRYNIKKNSHEST